MHNYNTRTKQKYFIFPTNHKYSEYCTRHQLPQILNQTNAAVLEKIHTHSFASLGKICKTYLHRKLLRKMPCRKCYIYNSNNA